MAAAALVATADGEVKFSELSTLDQILETVQELAIYDPHKAVDLCGTYTREIHENAETGRLHALDAVKKAAEDATEADIILRAAIAIGKSDGDFSPSERRAIEDVADALGLRTDAIPFDA